MSTELKIIQIVPDANQPREYFNATKLATLKASIKKHGIRNPIVVEPSGDHYIIQDGERRYRVAKELGFDKVPVTIAETSTEAERLIIQFHIQEQHEGWLPTEKANALQKIADAMGVDMREACDLVGLGKDMKERYVAFSQLAEKRMFQKYETPIEFAARINSFKKFVNKLYVEELGKNYPITMDRDIEVAIIQRIKDGTIKKHGDITRLKDSVKKDPKSLDKFINNSSVTVDELFVETKARGAYFLRQVDANAKYLAGNISKFLEIGDVKVTQDNIITLRATRRKIDEILKKVDIDE